MESKNINEKRDCSGIINTFFVWMKVDYVLFMVSKFVRMILAMLSQVRFFRTGLSLISYCHSPSLRGVEG